MIEVDLTVRITAENDDQADDIIMMLNAKSETWPRMPIVSISETRREATR